MKLIKTNFLNLYIYIYSFLFVKEVSSRFIDNFNFDDFDMAMVSTHI